MYDKIQQFIKLVNESDNIVFFGGAGVSTESGIPEEIQNNPEVISAYLGESEDSNA